MSITNFATRAFVAVALMGAASVASAAPRVHHPVPSHQTVAAQVQEDGTPFLQPHETETEKLMYERTLEPVGD